MRISAFPKIFALGTNFIRDIFAEPVEVSEKIDGSQFCFGKVDGVLYIRSKNAQLFVEAPEQLFAEGIAYVDSIQDRIPDNTVFYAEYLKKPKHNTLTYNRIPKNHLMLFAVMDVSQKFLLDLDYYAELLDIEAVPILYRGMIDSFETLYKFLEQESILGGPKIEGIVAKNFERKFLLGGQPMPLMSGKLVSEKFKEVHYKRWGKEEKSKSRFNVFCASFRTKARWQKAVQHLAESGKLTATPKDIGSLIKEVQADILEEESENIKEFLFNEFKGKILRTAVSGLPGWYKDKLLERSTLKRS